MQTENSKITLPPGYVKPTVEMVGKDGNIFSIMGRARQAMRKAGASYGTIEEMTNRVMASHDYSLALAVILEYVEGE